MLMGHLVSGRLRLRCKTQLALEADPLTPRSFRSIYLPENINILFMSV